MISIYALTLIMLFSVLSISIQWAVYSTSCSVKTWKEHQTVEKIWRRKTWRHAVVSTSKCRVTIESAPPHISITTHQAIIAFIRYTVQHRSKCTIMLLAVEHVSLCARYSAWIASWLVTDDEWPSRRGEENTEDTHHLASEIEWNRNPWMHFLLIEIWASFTKNVIW